MKEAEIQSQEIYGSQTSEGLALLEASLEPEEALEAVLLAAESAKVKGEGLRGP